MTRAPIFIVNPKSHKVATRGSVLAEVSVDYGDIPLIFFDGSTPLAPLLHPHLSEGRDSIFVEGGDGTVVAALSAGVELANGTSALPKFAILPGGSTNLAFKHLGLSATHPDFVRGRVGMSKSNEAAIETRKHKAMMVETSETDSPYVGFLLSTGSLSRAMLYTQQNLHDRRRGSVAIARAILQLGLFPEGTKYHDGQPVVRPSRFVELPETPGTPHDDQAFSLFSTFDSLSLGMRPFWDRGNHPIGYTQGAWPIQKLRSGVAKLASGRAGKSLEPHGLSSRGCTEFSFSCEGPVVFDGEELPMPADGTFRISASPDLDFIR